jgi:hypothetical protein
VLSFPARTSCQLLCPHEYFGAWTFRRQSVLESVDGDQDRAVDVLLGMSDPNFKSESPPAVQQPQMVRRSLVMSYHVI